MPGRAARCLPLRLRLTLGLRLRQCAALRLRLGLNHLPRRRLRPLEHGTAHSHELLVPIGAKVGSRHLGPALRHALRRGAS